MAVTLNASNSGTGGLSVTSDATGNLAFQTAGTTAVTVDTSQRVGIGTTSPTSPLQVNTAGVDTTVQINSTDANGGYGAVLALNNTGTGGRRYGLFSTSNADGDVGGGRLKFYDSTAGATRMLIDSSGNLLVKKTSVNSTVDNNVGVQLAANGKCTIEVSGDRALILNRLSDNGIIQEFFRGAGNQVGNINAGTSTVTYNTSSDYRLKQDIAPMTGALAKVTQLKPVTYKWKVDGAEGQGFIAHELQAIVPDCITGEKDAVDKDGKPEYQSIDTSFLVATLTAAIQELKVINDSQATSIATLTSTATSQAATITALTARIVALEK
jgi:hypothetical protein